jgi:D-alanine-D-alanine ligase
VTSRWVGKCVGVLMGGMSKEREISLRTGQAMAKALERRGYDVQTIDVGEHVVQQLSQAKIDVAVIALHGTYGEDGSIQGLLECLRIPYTCTGVMGSAAAMDKCVCKHIARNIDIPVPHEQVFHATTDSIDQFTQALTLELPVVVKPVREGSTIGVTIVKDLAELSQAIQLAAASDTKVMVEEFVAGTEVTVGWLCGKALTPLEIVPKGGMYDYKAKYTKGMTDYILPARIADPMTDLLMEWTERICRVLECRGMARADYIVRADGSAIFLELNTVPGMTETSLVPQAAAHMGVPFDDICERVLNDAHLSIHRPEVNSGRL